MNKVDYIKAEIKKQIDGDNKWLLSQKQMQTKYNVSKNTIINAINYYVAYGFLVPIQGKGFKIIKDPLLLNKNFQDHYERSKQDVKTELVNISENKDAYDERLMTNFIVQITKVRYLDKIPFILTEQFISKKTYELIGKKLIDDSVIKSLGKNGIQPTKTKKIYLLYKYAYFCQNPPYYKETKMHYNDKWVIC